MTALHETTTPTANPGMLADNAAMDRVLMQDAAAAYLGVSIFTLRNWRQQGSGPTWFRCGERRPAYRLSALMNWISEKEATAASVAA